MLKCSLALIVLLVFAANCCGAVEGKDSKEARDLAEHFLEDSRIENQGGWKIEFAYTTEDKGIREYTYGTSYKDKTVEALSSSVVVYPQYKLVSMELNTARQKTRHYPLITKPADELKRIAYNFCMDHYKQVITDYVLEFRYPCGSYNIHAGSLYGVIDFTIALIDKNTGIQVANGGISIGINTGKIVKASIYPRAKEKVEVKVTRDDLRKRVEDIARKKLNSEVIIYNESSQIDHDEKGKSIVLHTFKICNKETFEKKFENVEALKLVFDASGKEYDFLEEKDFDSAQTINAYLGNDVAALQANIDSYHGYFHEELPVWNSDGSKVYFISDRVHEGGPWWDRSDSLDVYTFATNTINFLDPGWDTEPFDSFGEIAFSQSTNSLVYLHSLELIAD